VSRIECSGFSVNPNCIPRRPRAKP
jgi:hypothetical protein